MAGYINDTQTLANIVSPAFAAEQAGINAANQQESEQLANQKSAAELPYVGQQAQADVAYKNAGAGLLGAQGQGVGLKNIETAATMPGSIQATNAENKNKYTASQAQNIGLVGQIAGQLAGQLDNVPAPARPAFMQQYLQSKGLDPNDFGPLANGDPDQMRAFSQKAITASADYQTKLMQENQNTARSTAVAGISSDARVQSAQAQAAARVQAAQIQQQTRMQSQTFEQAAVQAEKNGDHAGAERYREAAQQIRQLGAQTTASLVGQQQSPVFTQGNAPQAGGGNGGGTQPVSYNPPANAPQPSPSDVEAEMKRRGLLK